MGMIVLRGRLELRVKPAPIFSLLKRVGMSYKKSYRRGYGRKKRGGRTRKVKYLTMARGGYRL